MLLDTHIQGIQGIEQGIMVTTQDQPMVGHNGLITDNGCYVNYQGTQAVESLGQA